MVSIDPANSGVSKIYQENLKALYRLVRLLFDSLATILRRESEIVAEFFSQATILYLTSAHFQLSVLSVKSYSLEISPVHQKLWSFMYTMLKTLNSNFLQCEDTLIS